MLTFLGMNAPLISILQVFLCPIRDIFVISILQVFVCHICDIFLISILQVFLCPICDIFVISILEVFLCHICDILCVAFRSLSCVCKLGQFSISCQYLTFAILSL